MVEWCLQKQSEAARDGRLQDFENYGYLAELWRKRLEDINRKAGVQGS